jgi:hypothetical protein
MGSRTNKLESGWLGPIIHAISSIQEYHPTHFASIGGHLPRSYAVEALLGPSPLPNGAHSSSKWALGRRSRNPDGSEIVIHAISSTEDCHPTHFGSIEGHLPRSYAVEALSGPLPVPNRANSSSKYALGRISWNPDGSEIVIHAISSTQECHPTHFASIKGHLPRSYAVEALLGPSPLPNGANSSSKWALGRISRNPDGSDPLSMPFHPFRSIIQPTLHLLEVIYPGHMQWKHFWGHHHCLTGPIPAQNGLVGDIFGWLRRPKLATKLRFYKG